MMVIDIHGYSTVPKNLHSRPTSKPSNAYVHVAPGYPLVICSLIRSHFHL